MYDFYALANILCKLSFYAHSIFSGSSVDISLEYNKVILTV